MSSEIYSRSLTIPWSSLKWMPPRMRSMCQALYFKGSLPFTSSRTKENQSSNKITTFCNFISYKWYSPHPQLFFFLSFSIFVFAILSLVCAHRPPLGWQGTTEDGKWMTLWTTSNKRPPSHSLYRMEARVGHTMSYKEEDIKKCFQCVYGLEKS